MFHVEHFLHMEHFLYIRWTRGACPSLFSKHGKIFLAIRQWQVYGVYGVYGSFALVVRQMANF